MQNAKDDNNHTWHLYFSKRNLEENKMGFDLSVRWGRVIDEKAWQAGDAFDAVDFPDEWEADQSLFSNAPEYGVLREFYGRVDNLTEVARAVAGPDPFYFCYDSTKLTFPDIIRLNDAWIQELEQFRDTQIRPWLRRYRKKEHVSDPSIFEEDVAYYANCLHRIIGFVNFIVAHRNEENLYMTFG